MLDFAKLCLALMLNAKRLKIMPKSIIMLNMATIHIQRSTTNVQNKKLYKQLNFIYVVKDRCCSRYHKECSH